MCTPCQFILFNINYIDHFLLCTNCSAHYKSNFFDLRYLNKLSYVVRPLCLVGSNPMINLCYIYRQSLVKNLITFQVNYFHFHKFQTVTGKEQTVLVLTREKYHHSDALTSTDIVRQAQARGRVLYVTFLNIIPAQINVLSF